MIMEWSNDVIMEFLDLYEEEPSIWNPQNADHKDRNKVHDAWKRIQSSISMECSLKELKKKRENLMATYRKLTTKVKSSNKPGAGIKEAYKPEWFAYEKMASFLHNIYTPRKTKTFDEGPENEQEDQPTNKQATPDPVEFYGVKTTCYDKESHDTAATEAAVVQIGPPTSRKRKAGETGNVEKRLDESHTLVNQVASKPNSAKDESSLFCDLLYLKLEALDDDTREIAMHEINNLMFNLKKPKIQQPYWSYNQNYQQPRYFANTVAQGQGVDPLESAVDGSENSSCSCASSGQNAPTTTTPQYGSNENQIKMSPEYDQTFNVN